MDVSEWTKQNTVNGHINRQINDTASAVLSSLANRQIWAERKTTSTHKRHQQSIDKVCWLATIKEKLTLPHTVGWQKGKDTNRGRWKPESSTKKLCKHKLKKKYRNTYPKIEWISRKGYDNRKSSRPWVLYWLLRVSREIAVDVGVLSSVFFVVVDVTDHHHHHHHYPHQKS